MRFCAVDREINLQYISEDDVRVLSVFAALGWHNFHQVWPSTTLRGCIIAFLCWHVMSRCDATLTFDPLWSYSACTHYPEPCTALRVPIRWCNLVFWGTFGHLAWPSTAQLMESASSRLCAMCRPKEGILSSDNMSGRLLKQWSNILNS